MTNKHTDPDIAYAVGEEEGGATSKMSETRIPHKEITKRDGHATKKPRTTSGSGCGVTAACLAVFLFIVAAALVLRVM